MRPTPEKCLSPCICPIRGHHCEQRCLDQADLNLLDDLRHGRTVPQVSRHRYRSESSIYRRLRLLRELSQSPTNQGLIFEYGHAMGRLTRTDAEGHWFRTDA